MAQNGRDLIIKRGSYSSGTPIALLSTKTVNYNNTPVDASTDDDAGFIKYLDRAGTRQMSLDATGLSDDETLRDAAVTGTGLQDTYTLCYLSSDGSGSVVYAVTGKFFLSSLSETGAKDGAMEFTCSLQSSGAFTKVDLTPP